MACPKRGRRILGRAQGLGEPAAEVVGGSPYGVRRGSLGPAARERGPLGHGRKRVAENTEAGRRGDEGGTRHRGARARGEDPARRQLREHARPAIAVPAQHGDERRARKLGVERRAVERAEGAQRPQALGQLRSRGIQEEDQGGALRGGDANHLGEALALGAAERAARDAILDQGSAYVALANPPAAHGQVADGLPIRLERERRAQRIEDRGAGDRVHRHSARSASGCFAARPAPSAIWRRQLVPAATMVAPGAARTAGNKESSAIFIDASKWPFSCPNAPAIPQQLDSIACTSAPGSVRRSSSVASNVPNDFWWQWPWTRIDAPGAARQGGTRRPARSSAARYSSASCAPASRAASASPGNSAASSSRNVSRHEGSSPTTGVPASTKGRSACIVRRISARASATMPTAR